MPFVSDRPKDKMFSHYKKSAQMKSEIYIRGREENHLYPKKFQTDGQKDRQSFGIID